MSKNNAFTKWFNAFLEEKDWQHHEWEITGADGQMNYINSEVVIEAVLNCSDREQTGIKDMMVKIDFNNGDFMDYFKHLAAALVANRTK